jgi:hypothetical protein
VFNFTAFNFPAYSSANWSIRGAIIRHGPHHGAQKSTRTGTSDFNTSCSNVWSFTTEVTPLMREERRRLRWWVFITRLVIFPKKTVSSIHVSRSLWRSKFFLTKFIFLCRKRRRTRSDLDVNERKESKSIFKRTGSARFFSFHAQLVPALTFWGRSSGVDFRGIYYRECARWWWWLEREGLAHFFIDWWLCVAFSGYSCVIREIKFNY